MLVPNVLLGAMASPVLIVPAAPEVNTHILVLPTVLHAHLVDIRSINSAPRAVWHVQ